MRNPVRLCTRNYKKAGAKMRGVRVQNDQLLAHFDTTTFSRV